MAISSLESIESPTISRLQAEIVGDPDALIRFWQQVEHTGAPIFEEYDPESRTWLVTFVWRENGPTENVVLLEWMRETDFPEKAMAHLEGTDVWYASIRILESVRTQYQLAPNDNLVPKYEETDWPARRAKWRNDPLNPQAIVDADSPALAALASQQSSVLSMPAAPSQPWIVRRKGIDRGVVSQHRFSSQLLENERDIFLYRHPGVGATDVPMLVQFDGELHADVLRTPTVLDNLIAAGEIPPIVAVFVGNVDRGEELPCNADFVKMLTTELLPWARTELGIGTRRDLTIANGVSYGGLASMFAGLTAPETFGLVASQSGSFWWKPNPMERSSVMGVCDEYQWLPKMAATWDKADIRIWMEAGSLEGRGHRDGIPTLLDSNRHMRNVLIAKGYDVAYREYDGGHDYACWRDSQAEALIHLLGDLVRYSELVEEQSDR